ncbi:Coiled-coil-helix-coiled-coil-helix domain-containing protein 7 [Chionoecetes opilio]|uniref:Coiled-coil-helix-coiled-coil-helix domain-containing protein 7 n=1 Tax=Chionoecetes opilio TaxID=41210 RepID=A0A8J4YHJ0_CHIOP|nr:Coiled-coil-helix-coiled-coil-helix domain-containing protein 7 [Chionoecetes opilio]
MAASSKEGHGSAPYKSKPFTWGYGTNEYWKTVKVHPESGCLMTCTDTSHPDTNPCVAEQQLSLACREKGYEGGECEPYFENYRSCVQFWRGVVRKRRARGEVPALPPPDLRDQMKKEYMKREYEHAKEDRLN